MLFKDDSPAVVAWRTIGILTALFAEAWNIANLTVTGERASEHFGYFTVHSNILIAGVWIWMLVQPRRPAWFEQLRGAATAYIVLTGLVYALLVAQPEEVWSWDITFTNLAHHRLLPILAAADWLLVRSAQPLRIRRAWLWMIYPIGYLICCWMRWGIDGWVPYPFLDPAANGVLGLIPSTGQVLVAFIVGIYAVALTSLVAHPRVGSKDA